MLNAFAISSAKTMPKHCQSCAKATGLTNWHKATVCFYCMLSSSSFDTPRVLAVMLRYIFSATVLRPAACIT